MNDPVNSPAHYTAYQGLEVIDLTEQMNFCRGNAVKYIARAGLKDPSAEVQDLEKAVWYINREIARIQQQPAEPAEPDLLPAGLPHGDPGIGKPRSSGGPYNDQGIPL